MKVSRDWLQTFFDSPLPNAAELADALTFHAFEIESIEKHEQGGDVLDVKVTPNRGHDCLCHRGIAKELAAILDLPMKNDDLRQRIELGPKTDGVTVEIKEPDLCPRYIAGYIKGVKVGPSPEWLQARLSAIGQRSINNIVDATNYVMFRLGQPLHAFDAGKLENREQGTGNSRYKIVVRLAKAGEEITTLDNKAYELHHTNLLIVDGNSDKPIGIAGVKGGLPASITEATTDIVIESANFDGASVRKTAKQLGLRTDASARYEQGISPTLAIFGMKAVAELIVQIACLEQGREVGGELVGFSSDYALAPEKRQVAVSLEKINSVLGAALSMGQVVDILRRLDLSHEQHGGSFTVYVPFERLDLTIAEDLVEEVGRIIGYDAIEQKALPPFPKKPEINQNFVAAEAVREKLISHGYSEVCTSVFTEKGERVVANKVDGVRPFLRATLTLGLKEAYERNKRNKDFLQVSDSKIFEIGQVWKDGKETVLVGTADKTGVKEQPLSTYDVDMHDSREELPLSKTQRYEPFSKYPYIARDIAMWAPFDCAQGKPAVSDEEALDIIRHNAGELLVKSYQFDRFEKDGKVSLAFRLIFQSFDTTLTDFDANERMESVTEALKEKGFEIR